MKETKDILLINPPFGPFAGPYIAIPVLASYLKSRDVKVDAYDLNREFFYRLFNPRRVKDGFDYCVERVDQLNRKPELNFMRALELRYTVQLLSKYREYREEIETLSLPFTDFNDIRGLKAKHLFAAFSTLRNFPKFVFTTPLSIAMSEYSPFSSKDILESIGVSDFFTDTYRTIIKEELSGRLPKCVGFSVAFSPQILPAFQCAKIIKEMSPGTHITMGGPSISIFFRETEVKAFFDTADSFILDEGEIPLEMLLRELSKKKPDPGNVPGLVYLSGDKIYRNPLPPPVDMEKSPPPDYTVFQLDGYIKPIDRMTLSFHLSKGCYWKKCTFCRTRLPMTRHCKLPRKEIIYEHLRHVIENTGAGGIFFSDEASHPEVLEYISRNLIKDNIKINWRAHGKISWKLTNELCRLFKDAGCIQFFLGVESFSDRILALMKKGITVEKIDKVLNEINGTIPVGAYMMVGFPSETEAEAREGYKKIKDYRKRGLLAEYYYSVFSIFYGSEIWDNPGAFGISDIRAHDGQDLLADLYIFKSGGMERERAFQLYREFSGINRMIDEVSTFKEVTVRGKVIPMRYDLAEIVAAEKRNLDVTELPFVRWLEMANQKVPPFKPVRQPFLQ